MTPKEIIEHIKSMRDRESLAAISNAAEARDNHLSNLESEERRKRLWAKFSHLRKGDTVFVHAKPEGRNEWMYGEQLHVWEVKPRAREIHVRGRNRTPSGSHISTVKLTPFMLDAYKVSLDPTAEAFNNALAGDDVVSRKAAKR